MNPAERTLRRLDALQQRHTATAFVFGVVKKYGDDNAGSLTSNIAHSLFGTVFPLLLLLVTIVGIVLGAHSGLRQDVLHSALEQFPIVGTDLKKNITALHRNSAAGLSVGVVGMLWGALSLAENGIFTMMQVWNLPGPERPNYPRRLLRAGGFLLVLGVGLLITTGLTAFVTLIHTGAGVSVASEAGSAVINSAEYLFAFRLLTPGPVGWRQLVPGAVVAGVVWTVLQAVGGVVVGHYLRDDSAIYGLFAIVLGLFAWLYFAAELTVYSAEINVVLAHHLWPRAIVQPPLTEADQRSMAAQAHQNRRRPEQHVQVTFDEEPQTEDRFLAEEAARERRRVSPPGGRAPGP